jgi:hypothetical protein
MMLSAISILSRLTPLIPVSQILNVIDGTTIILRVKLDLLFLSGNVCI